MIGEVLNAHQTIDPKHTKSSKSSEIPGCWRGELRVPVSRRIQGSQEGQRALPSAIQDR